jgi:hypothetical protein
MPLCEGTADEAPRILNSPYSGDHGINSRHRFVYLVAVTVVFFFLFHLNILLWRMYRLQRGELDSDCEGHQCASTPRR